MVDLPLWIWIVVWGIAAWVAYVFYRMLDAAFTGARVPDDLMRARVMRFPVVQYHIAKSDMPGRERQWPENYGPESVFGSALRTHGPAVETVEDMDGETENWLEAKRIIEDEARQTQRRPGASAHQGKYDPEVMADAIRPADIEFAHPQLYGVESVTRSFFEQRQKQQPVGTARAIPARERLPVTPMPLLPKNPTEDDLIARDPEIREMVREIRAVGEEIETVREAREKRRARRGWFGWLRKDKPEAEMADDPAVEMRRQTMEGKRRELEARVARAREILRTSTDEELMHFDPRIRELYDEMLKDERSVFTRELERVVAAGDPPQKSEPIKPEPPVPATAAPDLWVPNTDIPADRWFVEK